MYNYAREGTNKIDASRISRILCELCLRRVISNFVGCHVRDLFKE